MNKNLRIYVFGASGDLARRKIFPALFELYSRGLLPDSLEIVGYARTVMTDEEFRSKLLEFLTCRYVPGHSCQEYMNRFLAMCTYKSGQYDAADVNSAFKDIKCADNSIFYMALPPGAYVDAVRAIHDAECFSYCLDHLKIVLEKPFGRSFESSQKLHEKLSLYFSEKQFYRIDHYLGKELVQNIIALRFANIFFEPLWNYKYIEKIDIIWKETLSLKGRAGYFDKYGIIRDVIQNHLIQILALIAMDDIDEFSSSAVAAAKLELLEKTSVRDDSVVGQYSGNEDVPGYLEEDGVPAESRTPTFARIKLDIHNPRWKGVPFTITAGKGLDETVTKVIISFKRTKALFKDMCECHANSNKLVIVIQPDPQIYLEICNKIPGEGFKLSNRKLNFLYKDGYEEQIPDAYASLILDVIKGDKNMFVDIDELQASWKIFDGFLETSESMSSQPPLTYEFGADEKNIGV